MGRAIIIGCIVVILAMIGVGGMYLYRSLSERRYRVEHDKPLKGDLSRRDELRLWTLLVSAANIMRVLQEWPKDLGEEMNLLNPETSRAVQEWLSRWDKEGKVLRG